MESKITSLNLIQAKHTGKIPAGAVLKIPAGRDAKVKGWLANSSGRSLLFWYSIILFLLFSLYKAGAQGPCMNNVPSFTINLTGQPAGVWTSPNISRNGQCCGVAPPDQCVYFYLTLDPNAAGIQIDMIGADPAGALFYSINCAGSYPGGTIKCINGVGPHQITFCKPGGNSNIYKITSISKPMFPKDDTVRLGCKHKFISYGVLNNSVTWNSIFPGTLGQYNSYFDSVNVASPTYSPGPGAPPYIDYKVCGMPLASNCGYSVAICDTIRIYNYPVLGMTVTPNPATFCNNGPGSGVNLIGGAYGGVPTYTYTWKNTSSITVGTGTNYFANTPGTYYFQVKDKLYHPVECPAPSIAVSVSQGTIPTVDAGPNQKKCFANPAATLNGTVQFAPGGIWSGGTGTFTPGNNFLNTSYSPSPAELTAGFVKLYLTTTGVSGCSNKTDSTVIYYSSPLNVTIGPATIACFNGTTVLNSNISGGTPPYSRLWNTGSLNTSIIAGQGNYSLIVYDSLGCTANANYNLVSPNALGLIFNVTNVTINGGNNGTASVTVSGGVPAYSVTWTPGGANSFSINNLVYGIYTASVTDANGCKIVSSTIVNEPRCLGFSAAWSGTNVNCYGALNGVASVTASGGTPAYTYTWNTNPVQTSSVATNLNAGVHTVLIQDANNCFQTANVTITEPTMLTNVMTQTNVTIVGGNNGAAASNPFGGTSPYTYLWNFGPTTSSVNNLFAGSYSVTVTDNSGCSKSDNVLITQPPCNGLIVNLYKNNVSCFGGNNGSALAVVSGAVGSYTINWSNGNTGNSVSNLAAGNYTVTVTDGNNCSQYLNFTITQPSQLSIGLLPTNVSCNGSVNGSIDLTLFGGTYPYSFAWNNGSTSEDLAWLVPGNYSVSVNDANGCSIVASASITQPAPIIVTYTSQNATCINANNGSISLGITGGIFPFTYTWSTGATTQSVSNLAAGGYSVMIKDANNCSIALPLIIPISQPDPVQVDSFIVACSVPGSNVTQVTVVPTGGNPGAYQVSFNNGVSYQAAGVYTAVLNNSTTYSVILKDVNNCASLVANILTIPGEVKIDSISFVKCYAPGTLTTNVIVYPSGGDNGPFSVSYNNGANYLAAGIYTANINIAGSYTVIVKDNRGCVSAVQIISLPAALSTTTSVTSNYNGQNISCFGLTNGSAFVSVSGGVGAYTYSWTSIPSQTTASANNLGAGTYSVTVKDINNCSITRTVTLTQPAIVSSTAIVTSNYNGQNISCFGYNDGSASVTPNGGTGPYTYTWNTVPAQTTPTATGLSAGVYSVIVTDLNSCSVTATVNLTQPASINSTVTVISNYNGQQVTCFGASDASVTVIANNGTNPFTYTWNTVPPQTGTLATNLSAGIYNVNITDANGCSVSSTVSISEPSQLVASSSITSNYNGQNISCFGLSDGSASVSPGGGTSPYAYNWSVPSQTNAAVNNLGVGMYSVTVTDANGCAVVNTVNLFQPTQLNSSVAALSNYNGFNVSCFGSSNGNIDISLSGGTGAYTYQWSNAAITEDINNIAAGNYSVIITDVNGCSDTLSVMLIQPDQLVVTIDSLSNFNGYNINCYGSNGSIYASVNGGVVSYSYSWNNGNINEDLNGVGSGNYTLTVVDQNNCVALVDTSLTQPPPAIFVSNVSEPLCNGVSNGSINVTTGGGVSPFTYYWSNGATTEDLSNITSGIYTVVYTDLNGCVGSSIIEVKQPQDLALIKNVNKLKCFGDTIGEIMLTPGGGTSPYKYIWSNGSTANSIGNLKTGTYSVNISDANGCFVNDITIINQPDSLQISLFSPLQFDGHHITLPNGNDGSIDLTVGGGTNPYNYAWSNSFTEKDQRNVMAGIYNVTVVDANGCKVSGGITLTDPLILEMPSGFSPNNDGKNDHFIVHGIEAYPDNVLTIFNRWGNIVYKKNGYNNEFNGISNNGNSMPDATYFVLLEINGGEKVMKGYVELRR